MQHSSTNLVLTVTLALLNTSALAQQQFDGRWNIEAIPERGTCSRAHHFGAVIKNGAISSRDARRLTIAGGLQSGGRIRGSIQARKTRVDIAGSLSGHTGSGTWTSAGRVNCSGQWSAEKRQAAEQ